MFRCILIVLFTLTVSATPAQQLFMPRDVRSALERGTRSPDGLPGPHYWQNHARYDITLMAMPPDRTIRGMEHIVYVNNSPDTLRSLTFKLLLNVHKPGAPRNYGAAADYLTSGIHIDRFAIDGQPAPFPPDDALFTNAVVRLPKALLPHDSVNLSVDWHYQVSLQSNREGMIDSTTYFLAYSYPRIAVYDDINGWDRINFMDSHEFYSDFNDYQVTVQAPRNYVVWGTGTLQTAREVLQPACFGRFQQSFTSDEITHVATLAELKAHAVTAQQDVNSWRFTASNIADMAFAVSDHFVWDASSVVVDSTTGRRASVQAAYNDTTVDYPHMVSFGRRALQWFSTQWPGIPYPFEKTTIVQGYADMEYPMMVNDGTNADTSFSRFVAEHEIAHSYMPFYMGINETRYGFMDEGWATTFEYLIGLDDLGPQKAAEAYKAFRVRSWIGDFSSDEQIPIIIPGDALTGRGFGNNEYGKASLGYLAAKDLLGDELFKKCLQEYMHRWNGKHPIPWDFFNTFSQVAGKNLNWFWNSWFFSTGYIDLGIRSVTRTGAAYRVVLDNIGGFPAPVDLQVQFADGSSETRHLSPAIWESDLKTATVTIRTAKPISSVQLEGGIFMDADLSNNRK